MNEQVNRAMEWRYGTKSFNPDKKVTDQDINSIVEAMRMSPSAFGLQPWKFIIVESAKIRIALANAAPANRSKLENASHLLILARKNKISQTYIDEYMKYMCESREIDFGNITPFYEMVSGKVKSMSDAELNTWTAKQTYIALGSALMSAAMLEVDSCAMEGIDPEAFDKILNLEDTGYTTTVGLALGYRSDHDEFANLKKVRFPSEKVVEIR